MIVTANNTVVKVLAKLSRDNTKDVVVKDFNSDKPMLKELRTKKYPFTNSDLSDMLDDFLEKNIIELPVPKRPEEFMILNIVANIEWLAKY